MHNAPPTHQPDTSTDNRQVLLATSKVAGWRHSYTAIHYVYFLDTKKLSPLTTATDALQYAEWSPTTNSHLVAVVRNNDVSVLDTDVALEHRITSTGSATMFNGEPLHSACVLLPCSHLSVQASLTGAMRRRCWRATAPCGGPQAGAGRHDPGGGRV